MGAFPTSNMPGFKLLHDRVKNALDRCQESKSIDFKESAPWDSLRWRLTKTAIAMGNLRDGGIIIIGVSERGETWNLTGIKTKHLETYDVDNIIDFFNKYCSPPIEIDVVLVKYKNDNEIFLSIQIKEFKDTPFICKKNGEGLDEGSVYIRPPGLARTTKVTNANQMRDLLELAAEKQARRMIETSYRIGMIPSKTSEKLFDNELEGL